MDVWYTLDDSKVVTQGRGVGDVWINARAMLPK